MHGFPLNKWRAVQIVILDSRVPLGASILFARLIEYHNTKTNRCFPSQRRLAGDLGVGERTIRNWLRTLTKTGYVVQKSKGGRSGTNAYHFWFPSGKLEYQKAARELSNKRNGRPAKPFK